MNEESGGRTKQGGGVEKGYISGMEGVVYGVVSGVEDRLGLMAVGMLLEDVNVSGCRVSWNLVVSAGELYKTIN